MKRRILISTLLLVSLGFSGCNTHSYNHDMEEQSKFSEAAGEQRSTEQFENSTLGDYTFGGSGLKFFKERALGSDSNDLYESAEAFENDSVSADATLDSTEQDVPNDLMLASYNLVQNDANTDESLKDYLYVDNSFMIWGLEKSLSRASLIVSYGNTSVLKNFSLNISFYNEAGEVISSTNTDDFDFPGWITSKVYFDFPEGCIYFSIDGLNYTNENVINKETDFLYHNFDEKFEYDYISLEINKESANFFTGSTDKKVMLNFVDKNGILIDTLKCNPGKFKETINFGAAQYEYYVLED